MALLSDPVDPRRVTTAAPAARKPGVHRTTPVRAVFMLFTVASVCVAPAKGQDVSDSVEIAPALQTEPEVRPLTERLRAVFDQIPSLTDVRVSANEGVVRLEGTVPALRDVEDAGEIVSRFSEVLFLINELEATTAVAVRVSPAVERVQAYWTRTVANLPTYAVALAILAVAILAARLIGRWERPFAWFGITPLVSGLLRRILSAAVFMIGVVLMFDVLGITSLVGAVLGTAGIAGIVLGLAFQNIIESYLAGILLSTRRLFEVNDLVEIANQEGKVIRLTSSDLVLMTPDGNHLRIPNANVFGSSITNYSRNPLRRFTFRVGIGTQEDPAAALRLARKTLGNLTGITSEPESLVLVETLGDSSVILQIHGWVDQREADFFKVRSEAIRMMKSAFEDAGIEMPEPIHRVHLRALPDAPPESTRPGARKGPPARESLDVSVDTDLDDQIKEDLLVSSEENLLGSPNEPKPVPES